MRSLMNNCLNEFTKIGLSKLMKPFENSHDDLYKLIRAFSVAFNLHAGLSRNNNRNDPYINHCIRVSLILSEEICCKDVNALSAALLHDVFEKTRHPTYDSTRLLADFGKDIGNIILTLSRNRLADRLDNARFLTNVSQRERAFRYKEETEKYVVPIAQATDERFAIKLSIALYEIK